MGIFKKIFGKREDEKPVTESKEETLVEDMEPKVEDSWDDPEDSYEDSEVDEREKFRDRELYELALDMVFGSVFSSQMIHPLDLHLIPKIFSPLGKFNEEERKDWVKRKVGIIYEKLEKAESMDYTKYPSFRSYKIIEGEEVEKFNKIFNEVVKRVPKGHLLVADPIVQ